MEARDIKTICMEAINHRKNIISSLEDIDIESLNNFHGLLRFKRKSDGKKVMSILPPPLNTDDMFLNILRGAFAEINGVDKYYATPTSLIDVEQIEMSSLTESTFEDESQRKKFVYDGDGGGSLKKFPKRIEFTDIHGHYMWFQAAKNAIDDIIKIANRINPEKKYWVNFGSIYINIMDINVSSLYLFNEDNKMTLTYDLLDKSEVSMEIQANEKLLKRTFNEIAELLNTRDNNHRWVAFTYGIIDTYSINPYLITDTPISNDLYEISFITKSGACLDYQIPIVELPSVISNIIRGIDEASTLEEDILKHMDNLIK